MNKKKKILALLVLVVLCLGIGTLSISATDIIKVNETTTTEITTQTVENPTEGSEQNTEKADSDDSQAEENKGSNSGSNKSEGKSNSSDNKETNSNSPSTTSTTTQTTTKGTCTLTIECKNILSNMDKLADGKSQYVPSSGYMLRNYTYQLTGNDTVYDVIEKANREGIITIDADYNIGYKTYYIRGINHIREKDCGGSSGWVYKVNGKNALVGCSLYKVSNGDNIVFYYVLSY